MKVHARRAALLALAICLVPSVSLAKQPAGTGSTATGQVFLPNPVASGGSPNLTDDKDRDSAALAAQYRTVTLTNLDGSGYLCGDWACVVSGTGTPAYSTDATFVYPRSDDRFEQVMGYYWTTQAQLYLRSLGFGSTYPGINDEEPQAIRINQWGVDNSFATTHPKDEMRFGKGGVDDAEDAGVILHEYGHQIHFSQSATWFSSLEAGSISEGFGDYWAFSVSEWVSGSQPDPACIAEWDATSYDSNPANGICLRRIDSGLTYPDDLLGEVHADGRIWSQALYDIHLALGGPVADTIILNAGFDWTGTTMPDLAERTVAAAQSLYGSAAAAAVTAAFEARGIL
jgi:hypothetical protein